jgi:hypothetical protein
LPLQGRSTDLGLFVGHDIDQTDSVVRVPPDVEGASIAIPAMTINGQKYDAQELSIVDGKFVGVVPINC